MNILLTSLAMVVVVLGGAGYWFLSSSVHKPELLGQLLQRSMYSGGRDRTYSLYVPETRQKRPALFIVLHGSMGNGEAIRRQTQHGFDLLSDRHGFLVAYPDGFDGHWNDCRRHAPYEARTLGINDVAFLRGIINEQAARFNVDRQRVFLVGYSNGGHLAFRVALEAGELVAAIAVIGANMPEPGHSVCDEIDKTISAIVINGQQDPINPYAGGEVSLFGFGSRGRVVSSLQTMARLGASGEPEVLSNIGARGLGIERWSTDSVVHELVSIARGGHTIPTRRGRMPRIVGPTYRGIEAADLAWQFFSNLPKDPQERAVGNARPPTQRTIPGEFYVY